MKVVPPCRPPRPVTPTSSSSAPGPAGSATAYHLAQAGLDVLLLEKTAFPREKVCGDGLTPRAVKQLIAMGIDTTSEAGWLHNKGLRIIGGGMRLELPWPDLAELPELRPGPDPRMDFDEMLARHAEKAGARLRERTTVTGPVLDDRTGRIVGVTAKPVDDDGGRRPSRPTARRWWSPPTATPRRLALAMGLHKRDDRPMGVAVRTYYTQPAARRRLAGVVARAVGRRARPRATCCPATAGSSASATAPSTSASASSTPRTAFGNVDYKRPAASAGSTSTPEEWGFRDENRTRPVRGAALPMGFNRKPHYARGMLLVGDSGGMVNPFNGEGIAYAMESGELAAEVIAQALARPTAGSRERALQAYPQTLKAALRRLLHARPAVREGHRQRPGHEAGHPARAARTRC